VSFPAGFTAWFSPWLWGVSPDLLEEGCSAEGLRGPASARGGQAGGVGAPPALVLPTWNPLRSLPCWAVGCVWGAGLSSGVVGVHPPLRTVTCLLLAPTSLPPWGLGVAALLGIAGAHTPDVLWARACRDVHHVPLAGTALTGRCQ